MAGYMFSGDWCIIKSELNGKVLDVQGAAKKSGTPVVSFTPHGGLNQQWKMDRTPNGWFHIVSRLSTNLVLDCEGASKTTGTRLIAYERNKPSTANQLFRFENGFITSAQTGRVLDICGASEEDCAKIILQAKKLQEDANQRWAILLASDYFQNNPKVPLIMPLEGFGIGSQVRVTGTPTKNFQRIAVDFTDSSDNVLFHFNPRLSENVVVRNSKEKKWGKEERFGSWFPFKANEKFVAVFLCESESFKVTVNDMHFVHFNHRFPARTVESLLISGDVDLEKVET